MNQFIGQRESTADGQNSDDEDGPMNYKFPATTQGSQNEAGMMSGYYGQRQTASGERQRSQLGAGKQGKSNMSGAFLQSKQMVFGADKKLAPSVDPNMPDFYASGASKDRNSYGAMMVNSAAGQQILATQGSEHPSGGG